MTQPVSASHDNNGNNLSTIGINGGVHLSARGKMNTPPMIPISTNGQLLTEEKNNMEQTTSTTNPLGTKLKPKPRLAHSSVSTSRPPGDSPHVVNNVVSVAGVSPEYNKCEELNKRIISLEADIEYLRCVSLNSEYVCASCEKRSSNNLAVNSSSSVASGRTSVKSNKSRHSSSVASNVMNLSMHSGTSGRRKSVTSRRTNGVDPSSAIHENMALAESSQRLLDVTLRHKRQI